MLFKLDRGHHITGQDKDYGCIDLGQSFERLRPLV